MALTVPLQVQVFHQVFAKCGATSFLYVQEDHHILTVDVKFKVFLDIRALVTEEIFFLKIAVKSFTIKYQ